jgi:hypothetical protein
MFEHFTSVACEFSQPSAIHSPKLHFQRGNADNFPLCGLIASISFWRQKITFGPVCMPLQNYIVAQSKKMGFLTSFSLSNKSTYLAYKILYRKISEINVRAKFCGFHIHGKFCSEKPLTTSVL